MGRLDLEGLYLVDRNADATFDDLEGRMYRMLYMPEPYLLRCLSPVHSHRYVLSLLRRLQGLDYELCHRNHALFLERPADELQPYRQAVEQLRVVWKEESVNSPRAIRATHTPARRAASSEMGRREEHSHILYTASSSWFRNSCGGTTLSCALSTCVTGNTDAV